MTAVDGRALDDAGWVTIAGVLAPDEAAALAERCTEALSTLGLDFRVGDKAAAGTRRLTALIERVPEVRSVFDHPAIMAAVGHVLGPSPPDPDVTFRSPQPGFGGQYLHGDAAPLPAPGPFHVVTTIVALCPFAASNGATGIVPGSHRRPDLQRHSGRLDHHDDELVLTGPAGTAFVFNGHLLHRGRRNESDRPRPALQAVWRR
jgi:hypothetical protein